MAIAIVKRSNYSGRLPSDFYALKSLVRIDNGKFLVSSRYPEYHNKYEVFTIRENKLYFSGNYNSNKIIKWFQKIKEHFFPVRYVIEYISTYEAKSK